MTVTHDGPAGRGRTLRLATVVVAVQGMALVGLSLAYAAYAFVGEPHSAASVAAAAVLGIAAGILLVVLAAQLRRRHRWAATPVLIAEFLCLPVGWGLAQAHLWGYAAAVAVPALGVLIAMFSPSGRAVLRDE